MRRAGPAGLLLALLVLAGCQPKSPQLWITYGRVQYLWGRAESLMELHCASPVPRDRQALCAEAVRAQAEVYRLKPLVDSELSKAEPDWDKVLPYVDAVIGALGKRALTPYTP